MPVVFRSDGYRFFFYSNEGRPLEAPHVHIERGGCEAKFWLSPDVSVAYKDGFNARVLHEFLGFAEANGERIEKGWHGMTSLVRAMTVTFDEDSMWVGLSDGRTLGVPLAWFPRLLRATREQRETCRISSRGVHWEDLDEDISIARLLAGYGYQAQPQPTAAE